MHEPMQLKHNDRPWSILHFLQFLGAYALHFMQCLGMLGSCAQCMAG